MKTVNEILYMFVTRFTLCLKKTIAITLLLHSLLDSPWCNNSCCAYQELVQGDFYSFEQEKAPFFLIYSLPAHKKVQP